MKALFQLNRSSAHLFIGFLAALLLPPRSAAAEPFELKDGDRVLFIGDTFFEREVDYGHIETRLTAAFPDRNLTFRNLAWAADAPTGRSRASFDWNKSEEDWLKRVKEQVALVKPTVAFLSYGMTAALESGTNGIPKFKADMNKLMDAIEQVSGQKVRFVLFGPMPQVPTLSGSFPEIDERNQVLRRYEQTSRELAESRSAFSFGFHVPSGGNQWDIHAGATNRMANGIHPTEGGNDFVAQNLERELLARGNITIGPREQYEILRSAIRKKNELFFHRWRPANWTYLFGFRKHEQGQNAVEIPRFEPLIEEWEKRIAKLRDLKKQDPATVKEVAELTAKSEIRNPKSEIKPQPLPTFDVADGFEVNLWAENPSLHKPIQMNWDPEGRLWIASSEVYPQIQPGQPATDSIVVLEDTDRDGRAERHTVFADGLLIPTGVAPDGSGGCYVAASHELLHFKDANGDGKADEKRVVLTSFGTEDTHHNLHTLRWGYDGHLYMNQSIYTHSHVETPHGVVRLNSAGIWRFDPTGYRLEIFTKGGCNPWGHHWDQYGNSFFTDGAGFKGVYHAMEGATYFTYADMRREAESITPGNWPKFCSLELVHSPNFPDDWQGDAITCDFRAHRIVRFKLVGNGSTFAGKEMPDLLRTANVTFRPIDVRFGPDGALYIADWSNPIIQHGEVDFRDPRRDKEHGRIWRVTAKGRPKVKAIALGNLNHADLLEETLSPNGFNQEQARRLLTERARAGKQSEITAALSQWVGKKKSERAILEGLWLFDSLNVAVPNRLTELLASKDDNIRTAVARILSHWHSLMPNAPELFKGLVADDHPRVRLEALRALAGAPSARSAELALSVLDYPMDTTLDYALWLTINDLAEPWIAAIESGEWKPIGREKQLEFGLKAVKAEQASRVLGRLLETYPLTSDGQGTWIELIGRAGSPKELQQLFEQILRRGFDIPTAARGIAALNEAARLRNVRPTSGLDRIDILIDGPDRIRSEAIRLAGAWKTGSLPKLLAIAENKRTAEAIRQIVFETLRQIGGKRAADALTSLAAPDKDMAVRRQAVVALAGVDPGLAIPRVIEIAKSTTDEGQALELWRAVLSVKGASQSLRDALSEKSLPEAAAKAGMRSAREGGRDDVDLVVAFAKAGGLATDTQALTGEVIKDLAAKATAQGDPVRGEWVYRRSELACITCHAIGGAGGKVGPDMTSIGASAPADYLVESLLLPNAKIKEGYHSVNVETKDGQSLTGTLARETQDELVLRNAAGAEVSVAKNSIESRQTGTLSLMPGGLLDNLAEQEKLDLIAFLSRLGKPGEFDASKGGVARRWRVYTFTHTDQQHGKGGDIWEKPLTDKMWQPALSLVSGKLTKAALQEASKREFWVGTLDVFAATEIQVAKAGPVKLKLDAAAGEVWIDGQKVGGAGESRVELKAGTHRVLVRLDPKSVPDYVRLESSDATFVLN